MINSEVFIIKRDGKKETFSLDKIKNAIAKAFFVSRKFCYPGCDYYCIESR